MKRRFLPLFLLGCIGLALLLNPARAADEEPLAGIGHDEADVDRALSPDFVRKHPGMDVPALRTAWKQIVAEGERGPIKVIIDTDIGTDVDDAFALVFALGRRELQVCAITTSRGEVHQRAALVSRMLQVCGRSDVPFAPGSPVRFDGSGMRDKPVDQFPFAGGEADRPRAACDDAQELFRRIITAHPGQVWLVVLGPMTNAAILIRDHPALAKDLKGIVCMGGAPVDARPETNIVNDPAAAALVCRSGLLKFVGTDEVTMGLLTPAADIKRIRETNTPAARMLVDLLRLWRPTVVSKPGPVIFDACPLVWLIDPALFATTSRGLAVDARGVMTFSPALPPCEVSTEMKLLAVHRLLMDTLTR